LCSSVHDVATENNTDSDEAEHNPITNSCPLESLVVDPRLDISARSVSVMVVKVKARIHTLPSIGSS
jgi:hypothetical protein